MKQIVIEPYIKTMAKDYLKELRRTRSGRYQTPEKRLEIFATELNNQNLLNYVDYVKKIRKLYPIIIRLQPEYYDRFHMRYFDALTQVIDLSRRITVGGATMKFYEWVSNRMRYDDVRTTWLLPFMKKLNIKTCCYCNAQYATTFVDGDNGMASYDLDHYYPQSKYPYLSTSFFNLVPSCGCCNKHKSNHAIFHYPLYVNKYKHLLQFNLRPESIIRYWLSADANELEIELKDGVDANTGFAHEYDEIFHIRELYTSHTDEVEEILWKSRIYNDAYREQLKKSFRELFAYEPDKFLRLYFGFYVNESDILKRPLSKMKQDIAKQIKFF